MKRQLGLLLISLVVVVARGAAAAPTTGGPVDYYRIAPELPPWGDYGETLWNGLADHLPRVDGMLQIERTGPFVPAIFFPGIGHIIVRDDVKRALLASGLTGVHFRPVVVARAVELHWEKWDQKKDMAESPENGEPENYILKQPHSPQLAAAIGPLWELVLDEHAIVTINPRGTHPKPMPRPELPLISVAFDGQTTDWFCAQAGLHPFVSTRTRAWLERHFPNTIHFFTLPLTPSQK